MARKLTRKEFAKQEFDAKVIAVTTLKPDEVARTYVVKDRVRLVGPVSTPTKEPAINGVPLHICMPILDTRYDCRVTFAPNKNVDKVYVTQRKGDA